MAKFFGITGGIACGKSAVTAFLRANCVSVVDADAIARSLVEPGPVLRKITRHFGEDILNPDGSLNRRALGRRVWADPKKRKALEEIMHGPIRKATAEALAFEATHAPAVGYDAALLIETGEYKKYRPLIVVVCSPENQLKRLMERNSLTEAEALIRINSQMPSLMKLQYADYVITNDGTIEDLQKRTGEVWDDMVNKGFSLRHG